MREHSDATSIDLDVESMVQVLAKAPVTSGVLFGSFARGDERSSSDVDIAVAFDGSLSSTERTKARLKLIDRLGRTLGTDAVDVIPLDGASDELRRDIETDGIVIYGSPPAFELPDDPEVSHEETMAEFDELLGELERVV